MLLPEYDSVRNRRGQQKRRNESIASLAWVPHLVSLNSIVRPRECTKACWKRRGAMVNGRARRARFSTDSERGHDTGLGYDRSA